MGTIQTNVRWADNTKELAANIKQGIDTVDAMRKAVDKTAQSLSGQGLFTAANRATAAILELKSVTKLTAAEQERNLSLLDKAIEKYQRMGQTAPTAMKQVAAALRSHVDAAHAASDATEKHAGNLGHLSEALRINVPLVGGLSARFSENAAALGSLGLALGTAVVGYEVLSKVFDVAQKIGAQASAIRDLSTETGIAIEPLQILGNATKDFGVTTEEVAHGVYNLSKRIAGGDASAAAAVGLLGLNIDQLKAQKPDEMFLTIVRAINRLPDAMRAVVASDLFGGKLGATILKIGPDLDRMIAKVRAAGEFMSEDAVKGADDFADSIDHLKTQMEAFLANGLGPTLGKLTDLFTLLRSSDAGILGKLFLLSQFPLANSLAAGFGGAPTSPAQIAPMASHEPTIGPMASHGGGNQISQTQALTNVMNSLRQAMTPLTELQRQFLDQVVRIGGAEVLTTEKVKLGATTLGISGEQLTAYTKAAREHETAAKKMAAATAEIASATGDYDAILASVNPKVAEEVKTYLARGVSQEALATKYHLTAVQVKALDDVHVQLTKTLNELKQKLDPVAGQFVLVSDQARAFGQEAFNVAQQADAMGVKVPESVRAIADAWNQTQVTKVVEDLTRKWFGDLDRFNADGQRRLEVGTQRMAQAIIENAAIGDQASRNAAILRDQQTLSSLAFQLKQVDRWVEAEKAKLDERAANWKEAARKIEEEGALRKQLIASDALFQALDHTLGLVGNSGDRMISRIARGIQASIPLWQEMLTKIIAVNAALEITQALKAFTVGFSIVAAFAEKGGLVVPGGIQHFDRGGPVLQMTRPKLPGKDSELIRAFPGEMVITPNHQAGLWNFIEHHVVPQVSTHASSTDATPSQVHNYYTANIDARGGLNDTYGLRQLARKLQNEGGFWETTQNNRAGEYGRARGAMNLPV